MSPTAGWRFVVFHGFRSAASCLVEALASDDATVGRGAGGEEKGQKEREQDEKGQEEKRRRGGREETGEQREGK